MNKYRIELNEEKLELIMDSLDPGSVIPTPEGNKKALSYEIWQKIKESQRRRRLYR